MSTLLEKALETRVSSRGENTSDEEIDLALAWAKGKVRFTQVGKVIGKNGNASSNATYTFLSRCLREAITKGRLVESR